MTPVMETAVHFYLSPHFDDAVFSCGGRIWSQGQSSEKVVVVTVFGGAPRAGTSLSSYAQGLHARWCQPIDAVQGRRVEDLRALALLGAEAAHWPYLDCIYRRTPKGDFPYAGEDALWDKIHASDTEMIAKMTRRMMELPLASGGRLYAPLGAGDHVDHRIVRQCAEACGHPLTYYEDFPYAQEAGAVKAALSEGRWQIELMDLSEQALEAKVGAIACYRSQASTFWVGRDHMATSVRAFAEESGSGAPAERYWRRVQNA